MLIYFQKSRIACGMNLRGVKGQAWECENRAAGSLDLDDVDGHQVVPFQTVA